MAEVPVRSMTLVVMGWIAWKQAARGKTSMGWLFGFKLHLIFNHLNEIVACRLPPGQVHDTEPVPQLTIHLLGKLFADKDYIGKKLAEELLRRGLALFIHIRKDMKSLLLAMPDKLLLNARNMAEAIIGSIKQFFSLNLPGHRLPLNAFLHLVAAITGCQINPIKLRFKLASTYPLAIPA